MLVLPVLSCTTSALPVRCYFWVVALGTEACWVNREYRFPTFLSHCWHYAPWLFILHPRSDGLDPALIQRVPMCSRNHIIVVSPVHSIPILLPMQSSSCFLFFCLSQNIYILQNKELFYCIVFWQDSGWFWNIFWGYDMMFDKQQWIYTD